MASDITEPTSGATVHTLVRTPRFPSLVTQPAGPASSVNPPRTAPLAAGSGAARKSVAAASIHRRGVRSFGGIGGAPVVG